jgi:hypothetical membrane protein
MRQLVALIGLLATIMFVGAVIWGGATYPGYDHLRQFISELGATRAVTAPLMNAAFMATSALTVLFWIGALMVLPRTALTMVGSGFAIVNGVSLFLAGVYSCDLGCTRDDQSTEAMLHDIFGGTGYLATVIGMAVLALASRRWAHARGIRPLGLACSGVAFVGLLGIVLEPELKGLLQRMAEAAMWGFILAVAAVIHRGRRA